MPPGADCGADQRQTIMNRARLIDPRTARNRQLAISLALGLLSADAIAQAVARPAAGTPDLAGRWQVNGTHTELEYGSELVSSPFGLPGGQRMGTIGNGGKGSFDFGMRNGYKPHQVERQGELVFQPNALFHWSSHASSKHGDNCFKVTDTNMSGRASMAGGTLALDIAEGRETVEYKGCQGKATSESLAGQKRSYEVRPEGNTLQIRQTKPASSSSSFVAYQRR